MPIFCGNDNVNVASVAGANAFYFSRRGQPAASRAGATSALVALGAAFAIARPKEKIALLLDIEDIALNKAR